MIYLISFLPAIVCFTAAAILLFSPTTVLFVAIGCIMLGIYQFFLGAMRLQGELEDQQMWNQVFDREEKSLRKSIEASRAKSLSQQQRLKLGGR